MFIIIIYFFFLWRRKRRVQERERMRGGYEMIGWKRRGQGGGISINLVFKF